MEFSEKEKENKEKVKEVGVCEICLYVLVAFVWLFFVSSLGFFITSNSGFDFPNIYVNSASVNPFAISNSTSPVPVTPNWKVTFLTAVWNFTFAIQSPNMKKCTMSFNGIDAYVSYGKDILSNGSVKPFELKRNESNLVKTTINTLPATLSKQAAKRMEDELRRSNIVNFNVTIKGLVEVDCTQSNHIITAHCENLTMLFSSNQRAGKMLGLSKCQVRLSGFWTNK